MIRIGVGSKNPAKIKAAQLAFEQMGYHAETFGADVPSGVSDQPFSDEETMQGAINRAKASLLFGDFDYGIGLEGGVVETSHGMFLCNWGAIVNKEGITGVGGGLRILLPDSIASQLRLGEELGSVIDQWTGSNNIKKKEGTIGVLTRGHITRSSMFRDVVICAFSRFLT